VPVMVHWLRTVITAVRRSWACSVCTLAQMLRHKLLSKPFIRRNSPIFFFFFGSIYNLFKNMFYYVNKLHSP